MGTARLECRILRLCPKVWALSHSTKNLAGSIEIERRKRKLKVKEKVALTIRKFPEEHQPLHHQNKHFWGFVSNALLIPLTSVESCLKRQLNSKLNFFPIGLLTPAFYFYLFIFLPIWGIGQSEELSYKTTEIGGERAAFQVSQLKQKEFQPSLPPLEVTHIFRMDLHPGNISSISLKYVP